MKEIFWIAARMLMLRDGASVGERLAAETDEAELVRMMGRECASLTYAILGPGRPCQRQCQCG
jgi:ABC-type sugar transport system ATPase subunit